MNRQLQKAQYLPSLLAAEDSELEARFEAACDKLAKRKQFTAQTLFRRRPEIYRLIVRLIAEQLSTRWIAKVCQVSPGTIAAIGARERELIAIDRKRILQITLSAARACSERMIHLAPSMTALDASFAFSVSCEKMLLLSQASEPTLTAGKENDVIRASYTDLINALARAAEGQPMNTAPTDTGQRWKRSGPFSLAAGTGFESKLRVAEGYRSGGISQGQLTAWRREGTRIARAYLQSGREIHRLAFERHAGAVLLRLRKESQ
jgi:hypothetical protein